MAVGFLVVVVMVAVDEYLNLSMRFIVGYIEMNLHCGVHLTMSYTN